MGLIDWLVNCPCFVYVVYPAYLPSSSLAGLGYVVIIPPAYHLLLFVLLVTLCVMDVWS